MKDFFIVVYTIFKILICLFITAFLAYGFMNVAIRSILGYESWNLQIIFYLLFTIFTLIALWVIPFIKLKLIIKIIPLILLVFHFQLPQLLPSVMYQFEQSSCVEDGICAEGTKITRKGQKIIINKESCLKYGWEWHEDRKWCDIRSKKFLN